MNQHEKSVKFTNEVNILGRITSIIALIAMYAVPLGIASYFKIYFSIKKAIIASSSLIAIFLPTAIVENLSFYNIFGAGGMYLSSITGNITNMKMPVTVAGQKIAGVEPGSERGDVIAIICVGVSSLVTVTILVMGVFLIGTWLVPILNNPILKPGFDHITPALYGAIAIPQIIANKKLSATPLIYAFGLFLILGSAMFGKFQSYILITNMILSVIIAYRFYSKGHLK